MVLCPSHHKIIDLNPEKYTVEVLQKMKKDHESRIGAREVVEEWVVDRLRERI